jgi:hypothetical protein
MRFIPILKGSHAGKHIQVVYYDKWEDGVNIKLIHNVLASAGKELQWVQTVSSNNYNSVVCKMVTRVDPVGHGGHFNTVSVPAIPGICKANDLLPFYWTADEVAAGKTYFSDGPTSIVPKKGRIWNNFVTALTEVSGKNVHHLIAITWGYDRMADGSVRENAIRRPTRDEMRAHGVALKRTYPDYKYT